MEPLHLPSEEEINAAYNKGKEAVVALFYETFLKMAERIQKIGWVEGVPQTFCSAILPARNPPPIPL